MIRRIDAGAPQALSLLADGLSHAAFSHDFLPAAVNINLHD